MRFIFFAISDFAHEGGGSIRIQGIINELSKKGHEVHLITNTTKKHLFHQDVKIVFIDYLLSRTDKRKIQFLLGVLPYSFLNLFYRKLFLKLKSILKNNYENEPIYFCEYLDNSIGYWLYKNKIVKKYINDLHGVATLEFKFQADTAPTIFQKAKFLIRYKVSDFLDNKVFSNAHSLIFASKAMQDYYVNRYEKVGLKNNYILPYLLSPESIKDEIDYNLQKEIKTKYNISSQDKIIFFGGSFKKTGGIIDLIAAFKIVKQNIDNARLFLLGDGPTMQECLEYINQNNLSNSVVIIGRTPYNKLKTYQSIADVIVCPDKQNVYSELIIHVKYLDALISGKIVINGGFKSVKEINKDEFLSVNFTPSDVNSLANSIRFVLDNKNQLEQKYKNSKNYTANNLTYTQFVSVLENR